MATIPVAIGTTLVSPVTFDARAYETVSFYTTALDADDVVDIEVAVGQFWEPYAVLDAPGGTYTVVTFTGANGTPASVQMFTGPGQHYRFSAAAPLGDDIFIDAIPGVFLNT